MKNILIIVGSLRKGSINKSLANAITTLPVGGLKFEIADISAIPLYNGDVETASFPESVKELKAKIKAADGIIVITPEYNRSVPGVLKNAIDWTSRPYGDSAWDKKRVAITGATGGSIGTALAQGHLKEIMVYLNTLIMGQPEAYMGGIMGEKLDAEGKLVDGKTLEFLTKFVEKFKEFIS